MNDKINDWLNATSAMLTVSIVVSVMFYSVGSILNFGLSFIGGSRVSNLFIAITLASQDFGSCGVNLSSQRQFLRLSDQLAHRPKVFASSSGEICWLEARSDSSNPQHEVVSLGSRES